MSTESKVFDTLTRPIVVGILAYISNMVINPDRASDIVTLPLVGVDVSLSVYFGLVGAGSSVIAQVASNWLLPMLPNNSDTMVMAEGALLAPALNGGANVVLTNMLYPSIASLIPNGKLFAMGALSELGGGYLYQNFILPYWNN